MTQEKSKKPLKRGGKPRQQDIRFYKKGETGTKTFKIEDLAAELKTKLLPVRRGNIYVGTDKELENCDVIVLVLRKGELNE